MSEIEKIEEAEQINDKMKIADVNIQLIFKNQGITLEQQLEYHKQEFNRIVKILGMQN